MYLCIFYRSKRILCGAGVYVSLRIRRTDSLLGGDWRHRSQSTTTHSFVCMYSMYVCMCVSGIYVFYVCGVEDLSFRILTCNLFVCVCVYVCVCMCV